MAGQETLKEVKGTTVTKKRKRNKAKSKSKPKAKKSLWPMRFTIAATHLIVGAGAYMFGKSRRA